MLDSSRNAPRSAARASAHDRAGKRHPISLRRTSQSVSARGERSLRHACASSRWSCCWGFSTVCPGCSGIDRQAVLFDLPARKFFLFGLTLFPQDFYLLTWLLIIAALSLVLLYGARRTSLVRISPVRKRCGRRSSSGWSDSRKETARSRSNSIAHSGRVQKIVRKSAKQLLWVSFAAFTGFTFVGFFSPIGAWRRSRRRQPERLGVVLGGLLWDRNLRQRRLPARAGVQVHVSVRALSKRDVRSQHPHHFL